MRLFKESGVIENLIAGKVNNKTDVSRNKKIAKLFVKIESYENKYANNNSKMDKGAPDGFNGFFL